MYKTRFLPNTRIDVADALRGIAVAGIILYHSVEHFNIFTQETILHALPSDQTVADVLAWLLSGKMYGIFAMLFGLSFFIMNDNQQQKGKCFSGRFAWRMCLLFLFGVINVAFYDGDILMLYACYGLLLIPISYLPSKAVWCIISLLAIQPVELYCLLTGFEIGYFPPSLREIMEECEYIDEGNRELFALAAEDQANDTRFEKELTRLALYYLYRYFLGAIDGYDIVAVARFLIGSVQVIGNLAERCGDIVTLERCVVLLIAWTHHTQTAQIDELTRHHVKGKQCINKVLRTFVVVEHEILRTKALGGTSRMNHYVPFSILRLLYRMCLLKVELLVRKNTF